MPQVDGVALIEMIRATPGYALAPIIMLTAMHSRPYIDRAFKAGATDYITKPFDNLDLRKRIQSARALAFQNERDKDRSIHMSDYVSAMAKKRDTPENPLVLGQRHLLGYGEFENYVLQLALRRLNGAYVYSLAISNLAKLASQTDPDVFVRSLKVATDLIQAFFTEFGGIGCYRGKGTFLFVTTARAGLSRVAVEGELNAMIERAFSDIKDTTSPRLVVGEPLNLDTRSEAHALSTLRFSVEDVERRKIPEDVFATVARRLLRSHWFSDEQRRLEQRTYKSVLQNVMSEELLDDWPKTIRRKLH